MASLGALLLLIAFVTAAYSVAAAVAGARRRNTRLIESAIAAFYTVAAIMTVASGVIIYAFVAGDYSIRYVQRYSDSVQPLFYKITSYWGGLDGSVMFWVFLLSLFGTVAVKVNRESHRELIPYVVAVIAAVEMFFLFLMVIHNNPFTTYLTESPTDGRGLNPLLQNFYMAIHPPTMYLGFVGLTIPFAFGMAALFTGHLDDSWLRAVRRWTMFSWFFLSLGLTLGMIWAYEELGWGGYWGWDPVENAGMLPWFTATAFLHSVMVQERRGMLRVWNVTLVIITFLLTIVGTFLTRSGVVQSIHAFGEDPELARYFVAFMVSTIVFCFGWVIYRLPMLKARHELDSWVSKEAAFLANNWILLFSALFILFATLFPTITEAINGERLTVGPPFFNRWMVPIGLILLLLTGVGPLLAWRKSTIENLREQFMWPVLSGLVAGGVLVALGVRVWSSGLCFALSAFVAGTLTQEMIRGANVRRGMTGTDFLTAMIGLVSRNRRRYGGFVVHAGIVLIFLGFAGEGFSRDQQLLLKPGQEQTVGEYTIHLDAIRVTDDGQKQMVTGHITREEPRRRGDRADAAGEVVLPQARGRADDRSRDPPIVRRRPLHRDAGVRDRRADGERRSAHQPARELGLVRLRHSRDRHGHRAAARSVAVVRGREAAGRSRDGVDVAAVDPAVERRGVRAARRDRTGSAAAAGVAGSARSQSQARLLVRRLFEAARRAMFVRPLRAHSRRSGLDC